MPKEVLKWEELDPRPLVALDQVLNAFPNVDADEAADLLARCVMTHLGRPQLWESEHIRSIVSGSLTRDERELVCAALLRMIAIRPDAFRGDADLGQIAIRAFDAVYDGSLYRRLGISATTQGYEKRAALSGVAPSMEQEADSALDLIRPGTLSAARTAVIKALNSSPNVIKHFAGHELCQAARIGVLFESSDSYLKATPSVAIRHLESARDELSDFRKDAVDVGTDYANRYLVRLTDLLKDVLERHFTESEVSKPAMLAVAPVEKKYPFGSVGAALQIGFEVVNPGPGHAFEVAAHLTEVTPNVESTENAAERFVGQLPAHDRVVVEFPCLVKSSADETLIEVKLEWHNSDLTLMEEKFTFSLEGQNADLDWDALRFDDAYGLEPVESSEDLVGRDRALNALLRNASLKSLGSTFVTGQRRVGKTSLVKTFRSILPSFAPGVSTVFTEAGEFLGSDAHDTVSRLGTRICEEVRELDPAFANLSIPDFDGTLAPLNRFLADTLRIQPDFRCLVIIDEFDVVPPEMYRARTPLAEAVFQAIRSISGKPQFGFVLVGGENIRFVMNEQGSALNKFSRLELSYLGRDQWTDFENLVRRPTSQKLEFSDEAVVAIWESTSGHPYFTKMVCREIVNTMVERRDAHVTEREVREAASLVARSSASNAFQHFWDDGVSPFEDADAVKVLRKRILLALASQVGIGPPVTRHGLVEKVMPTAWAASYQAIEKEIEDLERRRVLTSTQGNVTATVALFADWLAETGVREILETLPERSMAEQAWLAEEEAEVRAEEIVELVRGWGSTYRGTPISEDMVRQWLKQFGRKRDQRLMLELLQGIHFYNQALVREKLREAFGIVRRGLRTQIGTNRVRRDILVTFLGGAGKSSIQYARLFAQENSISAQNVVQRVELSSEVGKASDLQAIVILDDFVGTGQSAAEGLRELLHDSGDVLRARKIPLHLVVLTGFESGLGYIERSLETAGSGVECHVHVCDALSEGDRAFSDQSSTFPDPQKREQARRLAEEFGRKAVTRNPLGWGDCQALIVFDSNCPNDSLPVLWGRSEEWVPLFPRQS